MERNIREGGTRRECEEGEGCARRSIHVLAVSLRVLWVFTCVRVFVLETEQQQKIKCTAAGSTVAVPTVEVSTVACRSLLN